MVLMTRVKAIVLIAFYVLFIGYASSFDKVLKVCLFGRNDSKQKKRFWYCEVVVLLMSCVQSVKRSITRKRESIPEFFDNNIVFKLPTRQFFSSVPFLISICIPDSKFIFRFLITINHCRHVNCYIIALRTFRNWNLTFFVKLAIDSLESQKRITS